MTIMLPNKAVASRVEILSFVTNDILKIPAKTTHRTADERKFRELAAGRFALNQVVRIERTDDPHAISNKWFDFSYTTIYQLIQQGINDALKTLVDNIKKSKDRYDALNDFINVVNSEEKNRVLPGNQATQLRDSAKALKDRLDHAKNITISNTH
jgi:hypothetical protein